ncbi:GW dipeptide domain-containing protein [Oenococcus kitaharae]|uniref:Levansucrase n=1 Tax=Oenococcus kitaharae DSM 17330 TaxID=1045004 RepID=G9WIM3_9LACO|nr:GW dipeptide domain-containing protein [Oenococcus kitaharae]EHN58162.1 levansucrase [Oenococcus kitaharae DSM 17330]
MQILRKKLYKSGKNWVIGVAITTVALMAPQLSVSADGTQAPQEPTTTEQVTQQPAKTDPAATATDQSAATNAQPASVSPATTSPDTTAEASSGTADTGSQNTVDQAPATDNGTASQPATNPQQPETPTVPVSANTNSSRDGLTHTDAQEARSQYFHGRYSQLNDNGVFYAGFLDASINNLTGSQINALNNDHWHGSQGTPNLTISDLNSMNQSANWQNPSNSYPAVDPTKIQNLPAAVTVDTSPNPTTGHVNNQPTQLDVWDSWPVQNPTDGSIQTIRIGRHTYQVVIAMAGVGATWSDGHLYLFYKADDQNNRDLTSAAIDQWKTTGAIFQNNVVEENYQWGYNPDNSPAHVYAASNPAIQDPRLGFHQDNPIESQQWSGSAILNADNTIQLYYTSVEIADNYSHLATAQLGLYADANDNLYTRVLNDHIIFDGDGQQYMTDQQAYDGKVQATKNDQPLMDTALRDPHIIFVANASGGTDRYLAFEGSAPINTQDHLQDLNNLSSYSSDSQDAVNQQYSLLASDSGSIDIAKVANSVIGLIKLNDDNSVDTVMAPMITATLASEELERPSIVFLNGKYYLFTSTRIGRSSINNSDDANNVMMLGFVSDTINGQYRPLNGNGLVVSSSQPSNSRTFNYSYFAIKVPNSNRVIITTYMTNRNFAAGANNYATFGPSFEIAINGDQTSIIPGSVMAQGAIAESASATAIGAFLATVDHYEAAIVSSTSTNYTGTIRNLPGRNEGIFVNGPALTSADTSTASAEYSSSQLQGDRVQVLGQALTVRSNGSYYTFLKVQDLDQNNLEFWIDQRGVAANDYDSVILNESRNQWATVASRPYDGVYLLGPANTNEQTTVTGGNGRASDFNGHNVHVLQIETTHRKTNNRDYQYAYVSDGNQSYWVDVRALNFAPFSRVIHNSYGLNYQAYIAAGTRRDGLYEDAAALSTPDAQHDFAVSNSVNHHIVNVLESVETVRANGQHYTYLRVHDQNIQDGAGINEYWIDTRSVSVFDVQSAPTTLSGRYAIIAPGRRTDSIYTAGPALTSIATLDGNGSIGDYRNQTVRVLQSVTTTRASNNLRYTYVQVTNGSDTFWVDSRSLNVQPYATRRTVTNFRTSARISEPQGRNDMVYENGPALTSNDTVVPMAVLKDLHLQNRAVTVLAVVETNRGSSRQPRLYQYAQVRVSGTNQIFWVDRRALA